MAVVINLGDFLERAESGTVQRVQVKIPILDEENNVLYVHTEKGSVVSRDENNDCIVKLDFPFTPLSQYTQRDINDANEEIVPANVTHIKHKVIVEDGKMVKVVCGDEYIVQSKNVNIETLFTGTSERVELLEALREKIKTLVFRRVGTVYAEDKNFVSALCSYYDKPPVVYSNLHEYMKVPEDVQERVGIEVYKYYYGYTTSTCLRNNELSKNMKMSSLWFNMFGFHEFDTCGTFEFKEKTKETVSMAKRPPFVRNTKDMHGNARVLSPLICGHVTENSKGFKYTRWFNCSEQFYKLWTLIMYGPESFPSRNKKHQILKKLRCNNTALYVENSKNEGVDEKKVAERYRVHRTEEESFMYHGVYQAIAMYLVYGMEPEEIEKELMEEYEGLPKKSIYPEDLFKNIHTTFYWLKE